MALAFLVGGAAGYIGGWCDRAIVRVIDLMLSLPWLLLLLAVRALLPLNASPAVSLTGDLRAAGRAGMGLAGACGSRGRPQFPQLRLRAAGARRRLHRNPRAVAPRAAQPEAHPSGAVLDVGAGVYSFRSQPGIPGLERRRAVSPPGEACCASCRIPCCCGPKPSRRPSPSPSRCSVSSSSPPGEVLKYDPTDCSRSSRSHGLGLRAIGQRIALLPARGPQDLRPAARGGRQLRDRPLHYRRRAAARQSQNAGVDARARHIVESGPAGPPHHVSLAPRT